MKDLYEQETRTLVRETIEEIFKSRKKDYEELKYVLKPNELKATIRNIIMFEGKKLVKEEVKEEIKEIKRDIFKTLLPIIKEEVMFSLKEIDVSNVIVENFDKKLSENFKPIVKQSIQMVEEELSKRINKRIDALINLKTSTLSEINQEVRELPVSNDKQYLKEIDTTFEGDAKYLEWFEASNK